MLDGRDTAGSKAHRYHPHEVPGVRERAVVTDVGTTGMGPCSKGESLDSTLSTAWTSGNL